MSLNELHEKHDKNLLELEEIKVKNIELETSNKFEKTISEMDRKKVEVLQASFNDSEVYSLNSSVCKYVLL